MRDLKQELNVRSVWRTCNKICAALNRICMKLEDYFILFDPNQKKLISESNFVSALSQTLSRVIGLSKEEICELADYFRIQDGRINYAQFCSLLKENESCHETVNSWTTGVEWEDPLQTRCLDSAEERRLGIIISKIACLINQRKINLQPYFQDYELVSKNCGVLTIAHFERVLKYLNILLDPEEKHLLIKKFMKDNYTINYVALIEAVESAKCFLKTHAAFDFGGDLLKKFPGRNVTADLPKLPRPEIGKMKTSCVFPRQLHFLTAGEKNAEIRKVDEILLRIQEYVYKNQIKVSQYFKDFDTFNVGRINENQFRRGLNIFQNSFQGNLYLAEEEIVNLLTFYKDPNDEEMICWRTFEDDVDKVFTIKQLHKHPNCKVNVPPTEVKNIPRRGHKKWACFDIIIDKVDEIYNRTMQKIKYRTMERHIDLREFFRDFDKSKRGFLNRAQLRQVFSVLHILLTQEEILSLEYVFGSEEGFHYRNFVDKLEHLMKGVSPREAERVPKREHIGNTYHCHPRPEEKDIDLILNKLKSKVVSNGIKVIEFLRRFDTRNEKVVTIGEFERGLDHLKCDLSKTEIKTLVEYFKSSERSGYIDYWKFFDVVEKAMAQGHLEKSPLCIPVQHIPSEATPRSFLNFNERQILMRTLNVLSNYNDSNLEEVFRDFDKKLNTGTVNKSQLIRALNVRKIINALNANELDVLFKCFAVGNNIQVDPMFDYRSFLNALYIVSKNKIL